MKSKVEHYLLDTYGIKADYPFATNPHTAVFRNIRTRKWFAVLLGDLPKRCLGLHDDSVTDVLNLKCDPIMTHTLINNQKIFHAYHMNKEHWISVLLDSAITENELFFLIDMSYRLVDATNKTRKKTHNR